jgi:hypothetical protein
MNQEEFEKSFDLFRAMGSSAGATTIERTEMVGPQRELAVGLNDIAWGGDCSYLSKSLNSAHPHLRSVMECFWEDMYASVLKDDLITSFRIEVTTNWGTFVDSIRIYNTDLKQDPDLYGWVLDKMVREIDWNLNMAPEKELGQ